MSQDRIKLTCTLSSPLCGEAPDLASLLEREMTQRLGVAYRVRRSDGIASYDDSVHIPMLRHRIGGVLVPCCSSPIAMKQGEWVEHVNKRLAVEHAGYIAPHKRRVVAVGNSAFKSYHLPKHTQSVMRVVWFARATRRHVLKLLKGIHAIGQKRSIGYGRVAHWDAERIEADYSWFATHPNGQVLMRPLPLCDELPDDLIGARRDYGAVQPPMWHPDRYMDRVVPC